MRAGGVHPGQQTAVKRLLRDLVRSGELRKDGKRFMLAASAGVASAQAKSSKGHSRSARPARDDAGGETEEGTLNVHAEGFGFVNDVFLPPPEAAKALDGDRVRVRKFPSSRGQGKFEGRLIELIERRRSQSVGVYHEGKGRAWVEPNDSSMGTIRVPITQLARPGDVVRVRLGVGAELLGRSELVGEVSGSLGRPGDPSQEVLSVVFSQGFSDEFPGEAMDEADRFPLTVDAEAALAEGRKDLRALPLVTIDGIDARDFDDAVYAEDTAQGWRLWVAIADVSAYVRLGTALDREARARATSVYLPDRVLPMLPERLSNGLCSLKPDEDRLCWVAEMEIDRQGTTTATKIYAGLMRSAARCTYEEVQGVLEGKSVPGRDRFAASFQRLAALAKVLQRMRQARGALDFDLPEHKVRVGDDGMPVAIERRERLESHRLIESCMLAANEAVARFFHERSLPTVYRFHAEPDPDKLATFLGLAQAYGFQIRGTDAPDSRTLNDFMRTLVGHPEQRALNQLLLRSMMQAVYSAENVGHYGLAAEHYLHFTSPIRRYPDLIVHRLLQQMGMQRGDPSRRPTSDAARDGELEGLERLAVHCSDRERGAVQAEREVVSFYAALMMKDRVGDEVGGTVSSITEFGFFVELADPVVEGLVKSARLGPGGRIDPRRHALVFPNGRAVRVGQPLRVRVAAVSVERRQIDLDVVSWGDEAPATGSKRDPSPPVPGKRPANDPPRDRAASPHPGFDRLRALASRTKDSAPPERPSQPSHERRGGQKPSKSGRFSPRHRPRR